MRPGGIRDARALAEYCELVGIVDVTLDVLLALRRRSCVRTGSVDVRTIAISLGGVPSCSTILIPMSPQKLA